MIEACYFLDGLPVTIVTSYGPDFCPKGFASLSFSVIFPTGLV